ncbi:MAG: 2-phosphosulfolactate phosphatase [Planctomyces sp.]|jgi:2-phosphosulfolactate phosphatase
MTASVHVSFLPCESDPDSFGGCTAVIIDVLRASTTITTALRNGARAVVPCLTVEDALALRDADPQGNDRPLLGGERGGIRIDGFELSNSPRDYSPSVVAMRLIGFTTTNGTRALLHCRRAEHVIIGSFVNSARVFEFLTAVRKPVVFVCAGTNGEVTGEDVLFAGMAVTDLMQQQAFSQEHRSAVGPTEDLWEFTDSAQIAASYWQMTVRQDSNRSPVSSVDVSAALRKTRGGRNLIRLGYGDDIDIASQIDSVPVLPRFDADRNRLELWVN